MMPAMLVRLLVLAACAFIGGCVNSVNYHHQERVAISIQASTTDPTAPVDGNIGLKTRTVLVTPGKSGGPLLGDLSPGESASVVSDFHFVVEDGATGFWDQTRINSAFITGAAAIRAGPTAGAAISGTALSVASVNSLSRLRTRLTNLDAAGDSQATAYLSELEVLGAFVPSQTEALALSYFAADPNGRSVARNDRELSTVLGVADPFARFIAYTQLVTSSRSVLVAFERNDALLFENSVRTAADADDLLAKRRALDAMHVRLENGLRAVRPLQQANQYVSGL